MVVLAYLRDHPGASQQVMTEDLSMDSNTGVLVLNDLEDLEYVERRRDPADRRRHIVDITEAGLEALERAEAAQGSIEDEILGGLSASERATFRRLLVKALEDHLPTGDDQRDPARRARRGRRRSLCGTGLGYGERPQRPARAPGS